MINMLDGIDKGQATMMVINMTETCKGMMDRIPGAKGKAQKSLISRFQILNSQRVRLIEQHNLQAFAATL